MSDSLEIVCEKLDIFAWSMDEVVVNVENVDYEALIEQLKKIGVLHKRVQCFVPFVERIER